MAAGAIAMSLNIAPALREMRVPMTKRLLAGLARALNRTSTSERAAMSTEISRDMGLKVGTVKEAIKVEKAVADRLVTRLVARGGRVNLIEFKARGPMPSLGRGRGVSYRIGVGGRARAPHAFLARMPSGHIGVFQRAGKRRLAIYELKGPSIVRVFEKTVPVGEARRNEVLLKNVKHEIEYALRG